MENKVFELEKCAELLDAAMRNHQAIAPIRYVIPDLLVEEAYEIQLINVLRARKAGRMASGKKIGLSAEESQRLMNVTEPDYGHLFSDMLASGGEADTVRLFEPKVESEIAFVLKQDLRGPGITAQDVIEATDYIAAAYEIVDTRISNWDNTIVDTVADNASSCGYFVSDKRVGMDGVDLSAIEATMYKNGERLAAGRGSVVMGNPAESVAWLANKLYLHGGFLQKGEIILSGALAGAHPAKKGDVFETEFSILGKITLRFI